MAHDTYQLWGHSLYQVTDRKGSFSSISFAFRIRDPDTKVAAYCLFVESVSASDKSKRDNAVLAGTDKDLRVAAGLHKGNPSTKLSKPLDINIFKRGAKFLIGKLSIAVDDQDAGKMTATVLLDPGHIMLAFPMMADLPSGFPSTVSGTISGFTSKSSDPDFLPTNWDNHPNLSTR